MSVDAMTRLAAANPVLDAPAVESPERLRCLIEDDASALDLGASLGERLPAGRDSRARRRALAQLCCASVQARSACCSAQGPPALASTSRQRPTPPPLLGRGSWKRSSSRGSSGAAKREHCERA